MIINEILKYNKYVIGGGHLNNNKINKDSNKTMVKISRK